MPVFLLLDKKCSDRIQLRACLCFIFYRRFYCFKHPTVKGVYITPPIFAVCKLSFLFSVILPLYLSTQTPSDDTLIISLFRLLVNIFFYLSLNPSYFFILTYQNTILSLALWKDVFLWWNSPIIFPTIPCLWPLLLLNFLKGVISNRFFNFIFSLYLLTLFGFSYFIIRKGLFLMRVLIEDYL